MTKSNMKDKKYPNMYTYEESNSIIKKALDDDVTRLLRYAENEPIQGYIILAVSENNFFKARIASSDKIHDLLIRAEYVLHEMKTYMVFNGAIGDSELLHNIVDFIRSKIEEPKVDLSFDPAFGNPLDLSSNISYNEDVRDANKDTKNETKDENKSDTKGVVNEKDKKDDKKNRGPTIH